MGNEKEGGEIELNLELSIGCGKTENCNKLLLEENNVVENSRSNFLAGDINVGESVDLQRRREIHALRRQEARRKREEKIKKLRGQNGLFLEEDKLFLEAQRLQARVEERESRERDCVSEERDRKKGGNEVVGGELSLSLFTDNEKRECFYPKVQSHNGNGFQYSSCGVCAYSNGDCDSEHSNGVNDRGNGNRSLEQCSSAVSDYRSMSQKGGSSSDTGSHSSPLRPRPLYPGIPINPESHDSGSHSSPLRPRPLNPGININLENHDSWSQAEIDQVLGAPKLSALSNLSSNFRKPNEMLRPKSSYDQTDNTSSKSENLSREASGILNDKSTKQPSSNENLNPAAASVPKMPCVSATGNGPNGRTITGFLYKYTKREVSIMCVCHGSSFSPAGFVEHAGGVDISQPLKHITIVNPR